MIVSAVQELYCSKIPVNLNRVMDLFESAQQQVFSDMVPYWGSFCKVYQSPVESTISLPQGIPLIFIHTNSCIVYAVASCSPPVTSRNSPKVSQILLPPLPQTRTRENVVPLLSYSKLKGVKWRGTVNLSVIDGTTRI